MKKNIKTFCLKILIVLILISSVSAEGTWTTYREGDGLAENSVYSIAAGFYNVKWFGTEQGVTSFDGTTWTTYTTVDGLADNWIWSVAVTSYNVKWFGTKQGVTSFDGTTWTTYTTEDGLADNSVFSMAVDYDDVKWFGTFDFEKDGKGVTSFDGTTWTTYSGYKFEGIYAIAVGFANVKWFGTYYGVRSFDGTTWTTYSMADGLADDYVHAIAVDHDNVKWFGTHSGGVSSFNERTDIAEYSHDIPSFLYIRGNFPNPFNASTTISFTLPASGFTQLVIYNIAGQKVRELLSETMTAGLHNVMWDGRNDSGNIVSSGIYFSRLSCGKLVTHERMVLMK